MNTHNEKDKTTRWWIECAVLERQPTGVARFLGNVLREWATYTKRPPIHLIGRNRPASTWASLSHTFSYHSVPFRWSSYLLWQQGPVKRLAKRFHESDVYLAPNYHLPLGLPCHRALILHDLSFFRYPDAFPLKFRLVHRRFIARSIHEAEVLFVPSQFVANEVLSVFPDLRVPPVVTYEGWDPQLLSPPALERTELLQQYNIPPDAFVWLSPGSIFRRRRPDLLLETFRELKNRHTSRPIYLIMIGSNQTHPPLQISSIINRYELHPHVRWLGYQPEPILHAFYHACDGVIYLSEYEGFGLPVLEALALNKPVIASRIPVFEELYEDAARLVPHRIGDLLNAILETVNSPVPGNGAEQVVKQYTWQKTARLIFDTLRQKFHG